MRVIILSFVLLKCVLGNEESDEKYIDLLPEEEKRQFLEKIARRILEDYHNTNKPNESHVDMSESDLDAHSAYVQGILQEETQHLRDEKSNDTHRRDNKEEKPKEGDENNRIVGRDNDNNFVDLTLRNGKREKRNNVSKEAVSGQEYDVIPVLPIYDDSQTVNKSRGSKSIEHITEISSTTNNYVKISVTNESLKLNSRISTVTTENPNILRTVFVYDDDIDRKDDTNNEEAGDKNYGNYNKNDNVQGKSDSVDKNDSDEDDADVNNGDDNSDKDMPKYEFKPEDLENVKSTVIDNFEPSDEITDRPKQTTIDISDDEIQTAGVIFDTTTDKITTNSYIIRNGNNESIEYKDDSKSTTVTTEISSTTSTIAPSTNHNLVFTGKTEDSYITDTTISVTFENITISDTTEMVETTPKVSTQQLSVQNETATNNILNVTATSKVIINKEDLSDKALDNSKKVTTEKCNNEIKRANSNDTNVFDENERKNKNIGSEEKGVENKPAYYVYEVSGERPPFRTQNNDEQPYYAPVYNYAPEFAYFNPYNRFGPNREDNHDDGKSRDQEQHESDKRRNKHYSINDLSQQQKFYNMLKHKNHNTKPQKAPTINFNPNDYIDMDYFFGRKDDFDLRRDKNKLRSKIRLPNSDEGDHPRNIMQDSLLNHIRAVRKLLYAHKLFGYIPKRPKIQDETLRAKDSSNSDIFYHDHNKHRSDITLDYYFGRQQSHEVDSEHDKVFRLKLAELKGILPVTPNPVNNDDVNGDIKDNIEEKYVDLETFIGVLEDLIRMDNEGLVNYDWLVSAVNVQAALSKLNEITTRLKKQSHIHPNDLELLKYVIYLYQATAGRRETTSKIALLKDTINKLRKKKSWIPKISKKQGKFRSAIKMWSDFRTFLRTLIHNDRLELLRQFQSFLAETEYQLNDLHRAIKGVATITKYQNQNWFADLKEIYFKNADRSKLLTVLLHLSLSRLFNLIEESSKNGVEDGFTRYVKENKKEVDTAKVEFKFVMRLLKELRRLN